MLYIHFGSMRGEYGCPDDYFRFDFIEEEWFEDSFIKKMILDIDKCEVQGANAIYNKTFGPCTYLNLSSGVKNLILAYKTDKIIDASYCGDNCAKWLLKIAEKKDIKITLHHIMDFKKDFECVILNENKHIKTFENYIKAALKFL